MGGISLKTLNEKIGKMFPYISDILNYEKYQQLKKFNHHWEFSIFEHCVNVAYYSYIIARKLKLDYVSTVRGGMLHDFFLYDWKTYRPKEGVHGKVHPQIAYNNASEKFYLNEKEKDIILNHMFPVTNKAPRCLESWIVCIVDTLCATKEMLDALYIAIKLKILKGKKKVLVSQFVYSFLYILCIINK